MWIKSDVVMLPTKEKAPIVKRSITNKLKLSSLNNPQLWECQHLYILSDEEIKVGDWFYTVNSGLAYCDKLTDTAVISNKKGLFNPGACKKIIAATDRKLGLEDENGKYIPYLNLIPQPSKSFIEKFVEEYNKGNIITEVMVEYEEAYGYHIDIPANEREYKLKINPKDNTITIRKVKDSWNNEELRSLLVEAYSMGRTDKLIGDFNRWIEKIL